MSRRAGAARRRGADAHLRRARPARGRTTGRVFYGKDAFEGLRVLDRLGELRTSRRGRRHLRPRDLGAQGPPPDPRRAAPRRPRACPRAAPTSRRTTRSSPRRSSAVASPRACRSTRSASTSTSPRSFATSGAIAPRTARTTRPSRSASARRCASSSASPRTEDLLVPQVVWGHFPAASDGNDLVVYTDDTARRRARRASPSRASTRRRSCASRTSFAPSTSPDHDYASFMLVTMGPRVSERCQELFAENRYTDYLMLHGLGVEMAEALAEMWHQRIREELGFAERGRPDALRPLPPAVPRRALLVGLPRLPGPHRQRQGRRRCSRPSASASASRRASSCTPSRRPTPSSATTRMAKYFVA